MASSVKMMVFEWLRLLRVRQWIKNGFILAPLFFAGLYHWFESWLLIMQAVAAFIFASSAVYIANDMADIAEDKKHPVKALRPLAAGTISRPHAMIMLLVCVALSLAAIHSLPYLCKVMIAVYFAANIIYTAWLKHIAIIDAFSVASFYVMRVLMGCFALNVAASPWIILTTFLLALFLAFGKRYHEISIADYHSHKRNLQHYSRDFLSKLVMVSGGAAFITYAIYAAEIAREIGNVNMIYTVGFVAFGLFRYMQAVYVDGLGGEPEKTLLRDKLQLLNLTLWLIVTLAILDTA